MKQRTKLTPASRRTVLQAINAAPDGVYVSIQEANRSLEQNALMWALLADVSKQVIWTVDGHAEKLSPEEWKTILSASLAQENRMAPGVRGGFVMLGTSTSKMTIREMSEMVEFLYAFGAEQGVKWSAYQQVPEWVQ
ncbi:MULTISPECIES: recombination protein NinB [unclassified Achromobacter]|uniref:recombination protein NinB n=1 Tax=unclassified Achromobacter TaxID=2626865 RepID=UPI000B51E555|nr:MULTISPECIES: recombination protein NinB [unclassified Achromobacter]OWT68069.1 hypothetical protein CEY05_28975 [Achromobacter sp. HZ34]OWT69906.1 hypothetical protein CEY04_27805 [Achromobacter sp. HZ28]